jgi:hypothetical protein
MQIIPSGFGNTKTERYNPVTPSGLALSPTYRGKDFHHVTRHNLRFQIILQKLYVASVDKEMDMSEQTPIRVKQLFFHGGITRYDGIQKFPGRHSMFQIEVG